jgi:coenzyme F420-dependent glucose-6-phosphate dehydrogenase
VELPLPRYYEQAAETVREDDVAKSVPCGPDPERHLKSIREAVDGGFDHVYLHQIGPDQEGFFRFFEQELRPQLEADRSAA